MSESLNTPTVVPVHAGFADGCERRANDRSPWSMTWAARLTSALTARWTCAGVRVPSRYFDRAWN